MLESGGGDGERSVNLGYIQQVRSQISNNGLELEQRAGIIVVLFLIDLFDIIFASVALIEDFRIYFDSSKHELTMLHRFDERYKEVRMAQYGLETAFKATRMKTTQAA